MEIYIWKKQNKPKKEYKNRVKDLCISCLGMAVVLNLGQVVSKLLHSPLEVWSLCVGMNCYLLDQKVPLVSQPGGFASVRRKQLAHLSEVFLHPGDVVLDLLCLVVSGGD